MKTIKINGFLVVRLPEKNRDLLGRGAYSKDVPRIDELAYSGIDRMPWFDIEEDIFNGTLPENIWYLYESISKNNVDTLGIDLCYNFDTTLTLLNYSNRRNVDNEMIVVWSEELIDAKGVIPFPENEVTWLGYDVVADWSLLRNGVFLPSNHFSHWRTVLNEHGLLSTIEEAQSYTNTYLYLSRQGKVEKFSPDTYGSMAIRIGRFCKTK